MWCSYKGKVDISDVHYYNIRCCTLSFFIICACAGETNFAVIAIKNYSAADEICSYIVHCTVLLMQLLSLCLLMQMQCVWGM